MVVRLPNVSLRGKIYADLQQFSIEPAPDFKGAETAPLQCGQPE